MVKVLIVDDSPVVFKQIKRILDQNGYEIVGHAENGKSGIEMVEQLKPDIITLDVTMPIMNGIDMAKELYEKGNKAKIVMLSAMGDDDLIEEAKQIGIEFFATKPVKGDELIKIMKNLEQILE